MDLETVAAVALELGEAERACDGAHRDWFAANQAAHAAHGSPGYTDREPPEVGGGATVPRPPTERCWKITTHGDYNEMCPLPVEDWCDACRAMAERRVALTAARRKRGAMRAKLKRVTLSDGQFQTRDLAQALALATTGANFIAARSRVQVARKVRAIVYREALKFHADEEDLPNGLTFCDRAESRMRECKPCDRYWAAFDVLYKARRDVQALLRKMDRIVERGARRASV